MMPYIQPHRELRLLIFALILTSAFGTRTACAQSLPLITTTKIAESTGAASVRVRAELSYESEMFPHPYADTFIRKLRLRIMRGQEVSHDAAPPAPPSLNVRDVAGMEIRDLNGDGESEVLLSLSTTEESSFILVYRYDPAARRYNAAPPPSGEQLEVASKLLTMRDVTRGAVRVRLSYEQEIFIESEPLLELTRGGRVRLSEKLSLGDDNMIAGVDGPEIRDLDADGEMEILFNIMSRGAYCCAHSVIYRYEPRRATYSRLQHDWSNYRNVANLDDVDGDGTPEFVSANEDFSGEFCPFVCAGAAPIQIWRYQQGRMLDVTRKFPLLIRKDAEGWLSIFNDRNNDFYGSHVALAAYLAGKHLLNEGVDGWRTVRRVYHPTKDSGFPARSEYFETLRRALRENGYTR
jgi:hypothetical protein